MKKGQRLGAGVHAAIMSADILNSQPFSPPQNGPEDRAISVCNREKRATTTDEPDLSNRPRKVRVTPVPADTAIGNG
jgi:hypothetical protein